MRRALLALSTSTKMLKATDGVTHHALSMGASAASGATVGDGAVTARCLRGARSLRAEAGAVLNISSGMIPTRRLVPAQVGERVAAARDVAGRGARALKKRASAACRARAVQEALEACECCRTAPRGVFVDTDGFGVEASLSVQGDRAVLALYWTAGAAALVRALDADAADVVAADGSRAAASSVLLDLAEKARAAVSDQLAALPNATELVCVGHGGAGVVRGRNQT